MGDNSERQYVVVFNGVVYGPFVGMESAASWLAATLPGFSAVRDVSVVPMVVVNKKKKRRQDG